MEDSPGPVPLQRVYQLPSNLCFYLYPWLTIGLRAVNTGSPRVTSSNSQRCTSPSADIGSLLGSRHKLFVLIFRVFFKSYFLSVRAAAQRRGRRLWGGGPTGFHVGGDGSRNWGGQTTGRLFSNDTTEPHGCRVMWWEGGEERGGGGGGQGAGPWQMREGAWPPPVIVPLFLSTSDSV